MNSPLELLAMQGVSIWLDDLSRDRIQSGSLHALIKEKAVSGVTTNPTIFAAALSSGQSYSDQLASLSKAGASVQEAIFETTTKDVQDACDIFADVYQRTSGVDGRVSIEVEPALAMNTEGTVKQAKELHAKVNRENVMIKIPATVPGLAAITETLAQGISVNVTLIFSLDRYAKVISAYKEGIRRALDAGLDVSRIHSVASFFVSRVDTEIDKRLDSIGNSTAKSLKSKAALANARLAYELFQREFSTPEWNNLAARGAQLQRPLMASTGVKDPTLPDTLYVTELVARNLVNTMPEKTLNAVFDHGEILGDTISPNFESARAVLAEIESLGISYDDVVSLLEAEGVQKFNASWDELIQTVRTQLEALS